MSAVLEFHLANPWSAFQLFLALLIGHALCDFPLQGEFLAKGKNRRFLEKLKDSSRPPQIWVVCMASHCLIHAGSVWIMTGSVFLAITELVLHWCIDVVKCRGVTTLNQDQVLHALCKVAYVLACYFKLV